jgi:hypothetical protein
MFSEHQRLPISMRAAELPSMEEFFARQDKKSSNRFSRNI